MYHAPTHLQKTLFYRIFACSFYELLLQGSTTILSYRNSSIFESVAIAVQWCKDQQYEDVSKTGESDTWHNKI